MKNRILLLGLAVTLTISAEAAWSRSRFEVVPGVERKLKDEGLGELIIDVSKDGRYVTVDCSPDYKMTADWKYIDVRRKPSCIPSFSNIAIYLLKGVALVHEFAEFAH